MTSAEIRREEMLDTWCARADDHELPDQLQQLKRKDSSRAFAKLAHSVNGSARIVADPPLIAPIRDLLPDAQADRLGSALHSLLGSYKASLANDLRNLVNRGSRSATVSTRLNRRTRAEKAMVGRARVRREPAVAGPPSWLRSAASRRSVKSLSLQE